MPRCSRVTLEHLQGQQQMSHWCYWITPWGNWSQPCSRRDHVQICASHQQSHTRPPKPFPSHPPSTPAAASQAAAEVSTGLSARGQQHCSHIPAVIPLFPGMPAGKTCSPAAPLGWAPSSQAPFSALFPSSPSCPCHTGAAALIDHIVRTSQLAW